VRVRLVVMLIVSFSALAGCGGLVDPASSGTPGPTGPTGPTGPSVPTTGQAEWLDPHNAARAGTLAGVTVSPVPAPALPALTWSASAEAVAQAWANRCVYEHNPGRSADGTSRGENIAATTPGGRANATPAYVVGLWAGEWPDYTYATNSCAAGKVCGHYTQVVWRGTTRVGCAKVTCVVNSPFVGASSPTWDFFVCDYEPPGNYVGQRPY
jgi:pathogenesis-related protein 1